MSEIWTRKLINHEWAILFFNRNNTAPLYITCDETCLSSMGLKAGGFTARNLNSHTGGVNLIDGPLGVQALPKDDSVMMRLTPK
jgi:hypothetical protein